MSASFGNLDNEIRAFHNSHLMEGGWSIQVNLVDQKTPRLIRLLRDYQSLIV